MRQNAQGARRIVTRFYTQPVPMYILKYSEPDICRLHVRPYAQGIYFPVQEDHISLEKVYLFKHMLRPNMCYLLPLQK